MRRREVPAVPGVLSATDVRRTARAIARTQEPSGALPWFAGGHLDPWDHVESAMALSAAGFLAEAEGAYDWSRRTQRADGSWPMKIRDGQVVDAGADTNFCAYIAVGVWHHFTISADRGFARRMWPTVRRAVDFVLDHQSARGEIGWARGASGEIAWEALLAGCSSIHHSLRCALALAEQVGEPQPEWELALGRLAHVIGHHPEAFTPKHRYSMDWYYPILGGAVRGAAASARLASRWDAFVVPGLGVRCVDHRPWVTGAETCELALTLDAMGDRDRGLEQLASMQHLRDESGGYWTGLVFDEDVRWPGYISSWTSAAVVLAADALAGATKANGIFRLEELPDGGDLTPSTCGCP